MNDAAWLYDEMLALLDHARELEEACIDGPTCDAGRHARAALAKAAEIIAEGMMPLKGVLHPSI